MPDDLQAYDVTCPAGTTAANAIEVDCLDAGLWQVTKIWVVIPLGHAGLTGIGLAYGHNVVIPSNPGAFISGDDEVLPYELSTIYPAGVGWSVFLCNLDVNAHSWEVRFASNTIANLTTTPTVTPVAPADLASAVSDLSSAPDNTDLGSDV